MNHVDVSNVTDMTAVSSEEQKRYIDVMRCSSPSDDAVEDHCTTASPEQFDLVANSCMGQQKDILHASRWHSCAYINKNNQTKTRLRGKTRTRKKGSGSDK